MVGRLLLPLLTAHMLLLLPAPAWAAGGPPGTVDFAADVPFVDKVSVEDVTQLVKTQQKPGLVIVTQPWCGACKSLKSSVNQNEGIKKLMQEFVTVHAVADAGKPWQAPGKEDGYIPRVYFLDKKTGAFLDVKGPNAQYAHFFSSGDDLEKAMKKVLAGKARPSPTKNVEPLGAEL
mmetsp:Transcript_77582/g.203692  ORF Transcript_77582/g.203692 Transcript_77582/m.203692 type:complete len:176 (-) Transcript_77582:113-640(-)